MTHLFPLEKTIEPLINWYAKSVIGLIAHGQAQGTDEHQMFY